MMRIAAAPSLQAPPLKRTVATRSLRAPPQGRGLRFAGGCELLP